MKKLKKIWNAPHGLPDLWRCGIRENRDCHRQLQAVMDGKQVAVPPTLLSEHHVTFRERMKDFPVTIAVLKPLSYSPGAKSILKKVEKGEVDIIIGTHRLLQKDVFFKDLGLLIVDEEQRLG